VGANLSPEDDGSEEALGFLALLLCCGFWFLLLAEAFRLVAEFGYEPILSPLFTIPVAMIGLAIGVASARRRWFFGPLAVFSSAVAIYAALYRIALRSGGV